MGRIGAGQPDSINGIRWLGNARRRSELRARAHGRRTCDPAAYGGVAVINDITIRKQAVNEFELREEIEDALETRADREAERLRIEVHDGEVALWGRVHSWQEKRAVLGSISHAPGVTQVRDHLYIDP